MNEHYTNSSIKKEKEEKKKVKGKYKDLFTGSSMTNSIDFITQ